MAALQQQKHYAICVQYNGGQFNGWQRQPNLPTVQAELESALSQIANHSVTARVAGRTDAGVHANGQIVGFSSAAQRQLTDWLRGLRGLTGDSVHISWIREVDEGWHPRYTATARSYSYIFHDQGRSDPFVGTLAWCCDALNESRMHQQAQRLLGEHDFSSFRGANCQSLTPMRRVNRCEVRRDHQYVVMEIEANAFLLHMVRNIASALHAVGRGASEHYVRDLLLACDRAQLGITAPPQGLYLRSVRYPDYDLPPPPPPPLLPSR